MCQPLGLSRAHSSQANSCVYTFVSSAEKQNPGHSGVALVLVLVFNALGSSALHVQ